MPVGAIPRPLVDILTNEAGQRFVIRERIDIKGALLLHGLDRPVDAIEQHQPAVAMENDSRLPGINMGQMLGDMARDGHEPLDCLLGKDHRASPVGNDPLGPLHIEDIPVRPLSNRKYFRRGGQAVQANRTRFDRVRHRNLYGRS